MPIQGLTNQGRGFPMIAKLRKGGKSSKGYPVNLDYFRFTPEAGDEQEKAQMLQAFRAVFGDKPRKLRVYMAHETIDETFPSWCEVWVSGGLIHRCDGVTMTHWREGDKIVHGEMPCRTQDHKNPQNPREDAVGRLMLVIPQLIEAGYVGYVMMQTTSMNDIANIDGVLRDTVSRMGTNDLRKVPFILSREQDEISVPSPDGKRVRRKMWMVKLYPEPSWVQDMLLRAAPSQVKELEAGRTYDVYEEPEQIDGDLVPADQEQIDDNLVPVDFGDHMISDYRRLYPQGFPKSPRDATSFWKIVKAMGYTRETGQQFVAGADGDFELAAAMLYSDNDEAIADESGESHWVQDSDDIIDIDEY